MNERPFLDDIRDNPHEESARLVLADWLDDQGQQERAEFVRSLCRAAGASPEERQRAEVRAAILLARNRQDWLGPLPPDRIAWDRGTLLLRFNDPADLAGPLPAAWTEHPAFAWVTGFILDLLPCLLAQRPDALRNCPRLGEVNDLRLERQLLSTAQLVGLFSGLSLTRIRHLSLDANNVGADAIAVLKQFPWFARLRSLRLPGGVHPGLDTPACAPVVLSVKSIRAKARGGDLVRLLIESEELRAGEYLDLSRQELDDAALAALAAAPSLAKLSSLDLSDNQIGPAGVAALVSSPFVGKLTRLALARNPIGDQGAEHLAAGASFRELRQLGLSGCGIGPRGTAALGSSSSLVGLTELDLSANPIGDEGARALADEGALPGLEQLILRNAEFGVEGLVVLRASRLWRVIGYGLHSSNVRCEYGWLEVTLSGEMSSSEGQARCFASVARAAELTTLVIRGNGTPLASRAMALLYESPSLLSLEKLELRGVGLSDGLLGQLLDSPLIEKLTHLRLDACSLTAGAGEQLGRCTRFARLEHLYLKNDDLGDGVLALFQGNIRPKPNAHGESGCIQLGNMGWTPETAFTSGLLAGERGIRLVVAGPHHDTAEIGRFVAAVRAGNEQSMIPFCHRVSSPAALEMLARCPERSRLRALYVQLEPGSSEEPLLAALERLNGMASLRDLSMEFGADKAVMPRIVALPWFHSLTWLTCYYHEVEALLGVPDWSPKYISLLTWGEPSDEMKARLRARFGERVVRYNNAKEWVWL